MGVKCGHSINYCINNLSFNDVVNVARSRNGFSRMPTIDVNASWVVRRMTGLSFYMRVSLLLQLSILFTEQGCCVNIVCDGICRHHTKRSTSKRTIDLNRSKVDYHFLKCRLMSISFEREEDLITNDERQQFDNEEILIKKNQNN